MSKKVARFLEEHNLTAVVAPYEIKWKLMFHTGHRIACASMVFGYDRENEYGAMALSRISQGEAPLVIVVDKALRLPQIPLQFNPQGVFDMEAFHAFLKRNDIQCQITPIGDYVVYHEFSRNFRLFPGFYMYPPMP